jgi:hypothetical protein
MEYNIYNPVMSNLRQPELNAKGIDNPTYLHDGLKESIKLWKNPKHEGK